MTARSVTTRAAALAALLGLGALTMGAGPTTVAQTVAQADPSTPARADDAAEQPASAALRPIRLQPSRLLYRQIEGTFLKGPRGVFFDQARGEIYVADTMNDLVAIYDRSGAPVFAFGYNGEVKEPVKAVVDGRGRIYVLGGAPRTLRVFSYRGEFLHDFPFEGGAGKPVPTALGADTQGNVYVAESTTGQILVYDADQRLRLRFGAGRDGSERFQSVSAIAIGRDGAIYVADARAVPVQVYSAEGRFLRGWGEHTTGAQNFSLPSGIAVDGDGRVIVTDMLRQVVSVFTPDGRFLGRYGGFGSGPGALAFPSDVAADGEGRIYVVERVGNRLQVMEEQVAGGRRAPAPARMPERARDELRRSLGDFMQRIPQ
jgi:DNA-binding beta-propeller fold protein YncE